MARYVTTVHSPAPAAEVFAYLADFATIAQWDPGVSDAALLTGSAGQVGAVYTVRTSSFGFAIPLNYTILQAEPPTDTTAGRVVLEAQTHDFRSYDVITVTPLPDGCEVTYDADLALQSWRRPFDPLLRLAFTVIGTRARNGLREAVQQLVAA